MIIRKQIHFRFIISLFVLMFFSFETNAQYGTLKGKVIDKETKESIPFAYVIIEKDSNQIVKTSADIDGNYSINSIIPGIYDLKISEITHNTYQIKGIKIKSDTIIYKTINLKSKIRLIKYGCFDGYVIPLINFDPAPSGQTLNSEAINRMPW